MVGSIKILIFWKMIIWNVVCCASTKHHFSLRQFLSLLDDGYFSSGTRIFVKWLFAFISAQLCVHKLKIVISIDQKEMDGFLSEARKRRQTITKNQKRLTNEKWFYFSRRMGIFPCISNSTRKSKKKKKQTNWLFLVQCNKI